MTSFDGKAITYDAIGNPLTYDGGTFAWEGRKLTSFNKTGLAISYTYNENGIRTSKTVNIGTDVTTNYRLSGDRVTFEQTGADTIYYVYDTKGQLISMILNNVEYAYLRNAQNDIIGLINSAGVQVVKYKYSTWGEVTLVEDTSTVSLGTKNPYLYRGYRYDSETGLYYLQSRYYNPQWGRFLNADVYITTADGINGGNMFSYSANNPIKNSDPTGRILITTIILIASISVGVIAFAYKANESYKASEGQSIDLLNSVVYGLSWGLSIYSLGMTAYGAYCDYSYMTGQTPVTSIGSGQPSSTISPPYSNLKDPANVAPGKDFTQSQKNQIINQNMENNGGTVKSDLSGIDLIKPEKSISGVTPSPFEYQVDHIIPKNLGGTNSFVNAQVLSRQENRIKWDK
ncbi:MAG TPA: wall-associated protein [Erysipelotrichaceae bacterium]|nr:wall-associated protein [Erysipelotrichaceae bacterium]